MTVGKIPTFSAIPQNCEKRLEFEPKQTSTAILTEKLLSVLYTFK